LRISVNGKHRDGWVFIGKYSEYLISESLSDGGNSSKIKEDSLERFEPRNHSLGLGTRNELVISVLCEVHRYNGFIESIIFVRARVLIEYLFRCPCRVITKLHEHAGPSISPIQNPV